MAIDPSAVWDFAKEVIGAARPDRGRTLATVTRIDADGTTWVTTGDGGEAPAASVAAGVSVGDTVTLEWDGSAMGIRSNVSNPSPAGSVVRHAVARAQGVADAAQKVADAVNQHFFADGNGIHVTEATQEEWETSHSGANVLINSVGQLFRDGLNNLLTLTTENNARALTIWDGLGNAAANVRAVFGEVITLGNASDGSVVTIDSDSLDMVHGTTEMLHFGYGLGAAQTGTAAAPYYTVGTRAANSTVGNYSVAEGYLTTASGYSSHAEGVQTTASRYGSHAEGMETTASGSQSHAEGLYAEASGSQSHAEGQYTVASGYASHAEGCGTQTYKIVASGDGSHAEGDARYGDVTASARAAHAEGSATTASGGVSHAEGTQTTASGTNSHAEGQATTASGGNSHAGGFHTIAASYNQTALGRWNVIDTNSTYAVIVGNGTSDSARSNALTVDWDGNVECAGTVTPTYSEDTCTIESGATEYNLNACWSNGATCTISLSVNLTSALANGGTVRIATAPSGYQPLYSVIGSVYVTGATASAMAIIGTGGGITLNNRSGSSISTSANIYVSFTFVPA